MKTYFDGNYNKKLFTENAITINADSIQDWLDGQPPGTIEKIAMVDCPEETALDMYKYMIKAAVKPKLDCTAPYSYPALQTIAYQDKFINAIFCPIFRQIKNRVLSCLKKKFQIYCDMSPEEFETRLSDLFNSTEISNKFHRELDVGKYDKSQGLVALLFDCKMMESFGVEKRMITLWYNAHEITTVSDMQAGVKSKLLYQRKSGDASTFLGNTLFLMSVLSYVYDMDTVDLALFSGDDSFIVGGGIL